MSAKARDGQGRWRSMTIGVRVSPEENTRISALAALCGMKKQDYCICRMLEQNVVVVGNPKVYKALKSQMTELILEFRKLIDASEITPETMTVLRFLAQVYDAMRKGV